ncbi:MAG TPA: radical SAM protein [Spirochaetota bacterium]|nr:radical SAM protein [Spirochaetota bacterium]HPF04644.1 radical SAM protein [Spirochaetota bacterium]HPJ42053.1 radical SAM protein [Spirochaetota bacterium]HPR36155.1 radical SAM protein [Spirochaetota bacterium]HRX46166.1 radical SAM protein [Spirochaetota bacterium]
MSGSSVKKKNRLLPFSDDSGNVYDYPGLESSFKSGHRFVQVDEKELIPLPYGSYLFTLPERYPVSYSDGKFNVIKKSPDGKDLNAVSSFLASGYLRTYLPAYVKKKKNAVILPLWAYAGLVIDKDRFYVPAIRIDDDPRSDPEIHENHKELKKAVKKIKSEYSENRLVNQLSICSTEYNCLCARNFFLSRYECPVPSSPACNADCLGCFSYQHESSGFCQSQFRLNFSPTSEEISEIIIHHFNRVENSVASFGQGCEGEPLLRANDLARAIAQVRDKTSVGTINLNTNGSRPDGVSAMIDSGLDSIRISMNSPTEKYYTSYHRPVSYNYSDVLRTIDVALSRGIFVSINLFFMPGFTDSISETESLFRFLEKFPVNMIQTRNMNIDPDYFFEKINFTDEDAVGIRNLIGMLKEKFNHIRLGYYNPPVRK